MNDCHSAITLRLKTFCIKIMPLGTVEPADATLIVPEV